MAVPVSKARGRDSIPWERNSVGTWEHSRLHLQCGSAEAFASGPALARWLLCGLQRWCLRAAGWKHLLLLWFLIFSPSPYFFFNIGPPGEVGHGLAGSAQLIFKTPIFVTPQSAFISSVTIRMSHFLFVIFFKKRCSPPQHRAFV